jgi:hypothetical protein
MKTYSVGLLLAFMLAGSVWGGQTTTPMNWKELWSNVEILKDYQSDKPVQKVRGVVQIVPAASIAVPATKVATPPLEWHIVTPGESLAGIAKVYGQNWQELCVHNRLPDCHRLQPNQNLNLVVTDASKALAKKAPRHLFEEKSSYVVIDCAKTKLGYCTFSRVGGDPVCKRDQIDILARDMNIPKPTATLWPSVSKERGMIAKGSFINGLSFGGGYWKGPVKVMQDMLYKKGEIAGQVVGQFDACCNYFPIGPAPKPPEVTPPVVAEPPVVVPPAEIVPTPTPAPPPPPPVTVLTPRPPAEQLACDEWDVRASAGAELSQGAGTRTVALYGDAEVGTCPFKWEDKAGVFNEALIAGRVHAADDAWRGWDGKTVTAMAGFGLRRSFPDGSMDLYRLMAGVRTNNGSQGLYSHDARWKVLGLYGTHYRVEDDGTNETHYRWGLNVHFGQATGSASYSGSSLPLPRYNGSIEVGVRRYVDPQGEDIRRFWELNATVVSPDYAGISPRVGVCNGDDTLCGLVGVNIDVQNGGVAAMVGVQVNTPGVIRYNRDGRIMKDVVEAAKVNGTTFSFAPATKRK